jgi:hypothetical protein
MRKTGGISFWRYIRIKKEFEKCFEGREFFRL